jgi:hypothetical protein
MTAPTVARHGSATGVVEALRVLGAALLAVMGWIHLDLWRDGYRESTAAALWWKSFWVEVAAVVVLAVLAQLVRPRRSRDMGRT